MRRSLVPFSRPEPLVDGQSLADFIITMSGFRFSVHRGRRLVGPPSHSNQPHTRTLAVSELGQRDKTLTVHGLTALLLVA